MGALPLGPLGAMSTISTTLDPLHLRIIHARFGWNPALSFQEEDENLNFSIRTPPPWPLLGAKCGHPWTCHEQLLFFTYQGTYIQHNMALTILVLQKKSFEKLVSFLSGGPCPWYPLGATPTIWTNLGPIHLRIIPAKFGWNPAVSFQEEDENVKKFTHDGWRTTHDGRRAMAIAHLSLRLRWAKK